MNPTSLAITVAMVAAALALAALALWAWGRAQGSQVVAEAAAIVGGAAPEGS
jgi:hypothetical protein